MTINNANSIYSFFLYYFDVKRGSEDARIIWRALRESNFSVEIWGHKFFIHTESEGGPVTAVTTGPYHIDCLGGSSAAPVGYRFKGY